MVLLKNLALSVLLRKNLLKITKVNLCRNLTFTHFQQVRNLIFCTEKSPNFRIVDRRFCTDLSEISEEDSAEDLLGVEEEVSNSNRVEMATEEMFQKIAAGDPVRLKKLKLLEFEIAVLREEGSRVPEHMKMSNWQDLLEIDSLSRRKKALAYLRLNELKKMSDIRKSNNKREISLKRKEELGFHYYGLSGHSMFMRIYDRDMNQLLNFRTWTSKFEVIIDCSYQEYMTELNTKFCAKQIFMCFTEARLHRTPCQVKLFNLKRGDLLTKILPSYVSGLNEQYGADIHAESYLKFYPKDKLVYLTPHTRTELKEFNPDDIYIIGGFVDKGTGEKASLAQAKQNKLRMCRLPIDEYKSWKKGTKALPLNTVLAILQDMAFYNDWNKAFKNLPTRNLNG